MSERRRARASRRPVSAAPSSPGSSGGVPWQLTDDGTGSEFWGDDSVVRAFIAEHGLPAPHPAFWGSPRALRDHCAHVWCIRNGYVTRWGTPNWPRVRDLGIGATGSARSRARLRGPS